MPGIPASTKHELSLAETWVEQYADYLYTYALYRVPDVSVAEDMVQETFVAALSVRQKYKGKSSEKTWLTAILKNKIMDFFRKRYRDNISLRENLDEQQSDAFFDGHDNWAIRPQEWKQNPQKALEQSEFMDVLAKCLSAISPKQADAFRLRELSQADTDEICKVLDISATNYWVLMHRARLQIRHCLEVRWFAPLPEGDRT